MVAMALFPDVQKKLQSLLAEITSPDQLPKPEDYENLPYFQAVVFEVLRWRPPLPIGVAHVLDADDTYREYDIPKGTIVIAVCRMAFTFRVLLLIFVP